MTVEKKISVAINNQSKLRPYIHALPRAMARPRMVRKFNITRLGAMTVRGCNVKFFHPW